METTIGVIVILISIVIIKRMFGLFTRVIKTPVKYPNIPPIERPEPKNTPTNNDETVIKKPNKDPKDPTTESTGPENTSTLQDNSDGVRVLLVLVSVVVAVLAYGALATTHDFENIAVNYSSFEIGRLVWSALIGIAYPIVGAIVVKLCALLRQVAYLGKVNSLSKDKIIWLALVWPITILFSLFVYPCLFFINLLF